MGIEAGNYYEDAILREQNGVERQDERDALDERLERASITQETQGGVESIQVDVERQEQVQSILERFEGLAERDGLAGVDVFQEFIISADGEIQTQFIDPSNMGNLFNTVKNSGRFPVNEFEFQQAVIEGSVLSAQEESTEAKTTQTEAEMRRIEIEDGEQQVEAVDSEAEARYNEVIASLNRTNTQAEEIRSLRHVTESFNLTEQLKTLFNQDINLPEVPELPLTQQKIDDFMAEFDRANRAIQNVIGYLESNRELEQNILPQAQAQGPEVYGQVRSSLISLDSGFEARIMRFEMAPTDFGELPAEQMVRVSGALGTRVDDVGEEAQQSGNIFTLVESDGTQIDYDVVTNERSLSVDGYSLESQIDDTADYQTPKLEYMRVEQEHLPKLQKIIAAGSALEAEQLQDDNIEEIKEVIKTAVGYSYFLELGLETLTSAGEIKSAISDAYSEHNTPLQEARDEYRATLIGLRDAHFGALEKKDKKVKQVLKLFESIGFSMIPQYITDQIVDTLNSSAAMRAQLGMNEQIDFSDGKLGFDSYAGEGENIGLADKKAFAEFVNNMLGVTDREGNPPINVSAIGTSSPLTWSESQQGDGRFRNLLAQSGLLIGGAGRAIRNLNGNI